MDADKTPIHDSDFDCLKPVSTPPPPAAISTTTHYGGNGDMKKRLQALIPEWPGVAEHNGRNSAGQYRASYLTHDMALTKDEAWPWLCEWNRKNIPPMDERELRSCLENGEKYGKNPKGCKLEDQPKPKAPRKVTASPGEGGNGDEPAPWDEPAEATVNETDETVKQDEPRPMTLVSTSMDKVDPRPIDWLWQGRFPLGMLSLMVGYPGMGKSFVALDMAARISRGTPWPDEPDNKQPIGTIYLMIFEEDLHRAIRPRLDACGADVTKIHAFKGVQSGNKVHKHFDVLQHMYLLETFATEHPDTRLVVIDPITSALGEGDENTGKDMRSALTAVSEFCERTQITVLGIAHFAKRMDVSALYKIAGSVAFGAVARAVWVVNQDPTKEGEPEPVRKLLHEKSNYPGKKTGLSFIIDGNVQWSDDILYQTASEALAGNSKKGEKLEDAEQVILDCLSSGLEKHTDDLTKDVLALDVAERTYIRARGQLKSRGLIGRKKAGMDGGWFWFKKAKVVQNEPA